MSKTSRIFLQPHTAVVHQENMIRSRRGFLKGIALGAAAVIAAPVLSRASAYAAEAGGNKVLILYFSHSGNTRRLAGQIHGRVGGDMVELKTVVPYPQDYDAVVDMAQKEQQSNARPQIATEIPNWDEYHSSASPTGGGLCLCLSSRFWKSTTWGTKTSFRSAPMKEAVWAAAKATSGSSARRRIC